VSGIITYQELDAIAKTDNDFVRASEYMRELALKSLEDNSDIGALIDTRNQAKALGEYIAKKVKSREAKLEAENNLAEIRIRYERELGKLIKRMQERGELAPKNGKRNPPNGLLGGLEEPMRLTDVGVTHMQSHRWQRMASLPEEKFEEALSEVKENGWELTSFDIEKRAKEHEREQREIIVLQAAAVTPITKPIPRNYQTGDVVCIGGHLLICNDNTSEQVRSILNSYAPAALAFCDPPYNADVAAWDNGGFVWQQDYLANLADIVAVTPGIGNIPGFMQQTAMPYKWSTATFINNGMTRGALGFGNWIYTALFSDKSIHRNAQDVYTISISSADADDLGAKRQKPPLYLSWLFNLLTGEGETIIDAFGGSGTSVMVAHNLNRRCISIEKDPHTFTLMVARVENALESKAQLQEAA
jgi:16S rRNA G966 N2-methylase RsmD